MTHDQIVCHIYDSLSAYDDYGLPGFSYEVRMECRPDPDSAQRADVMAFNKGNRRAEFIIEVKPSLSQPSDAELAVAQLERYGRLVLAETPRAKALPIVVAESISGVRGVDWKGRAVIWTLAMFDDIVGRRALPEVREDFLSQLPGLIGKVPMTFRSVLK